jgi:uncharacterized protein
MSSATQRTCLRLAPGLDLPLDIITMRSLVLGVSGSGKSTFGRLLAENIHAAGQRFCVIDLKNDWYGLKSTADGKHPAIPVVIIGGPRGDIPLDADGGAAVADIVAEVQQSFVIDLDALSKGKGIRFLGAFLERLYDVNRDPLLLICDEADRYGPQKPMSVEANVTLGAADDIARRGRKRGIGSLWLSQRPAVINKNITSQCELVVTFRTSSDLDQKELRSHIGRVASPEQVEETMRTVGGLANGEAIFTSQHPDLRLFRTVQLPLPQTFDSSATPKVGERRIEPKQLAAPDLAALGERIKATVEKAKTEDPKHLRKRVLELEAALRKAGAVVPKAPPPERIEVPVVKDTQIKRVEDLVEKMSKLGDAVAVSTRELTDALVKAAPKAAPAVVTMHPQRVVSHASRAARADIASAAAGYMRKTAASPVGDTTIPPVRQKILDALAWLEAIHIAPGDRTQVAFLSDQSPTSGSFANHLGALRSAGLIEYPSSGAVGLTDAGRAIAVAPATPATSEEVQRAVLGKVPPVRRRILEELINAYPEDVTREDLARLSDQSPTSGSYANHLGALRSLGVIEYPAQGWVCAAGVLFVTPP